MIVARFSIFPGRMAEIKVIVSETILRIVISEICCEKHFFYLLLREEGANLSRTDIFVI